LIPSIFALKQWKKVYDPLIEKFHSIKPDYIHNFSYDSDFSLSAISKEDNDKYILSSRVRANRNFAGFPHSMKLDKEWRHIIFEAASQVYKEQIEPKAFEIMVQEYDWLDFDPLEFEEHDGSKRFSEEDLRKNLKDNMNFKDCSKIHEDAKGVFFWDYMWFLSDEDGTIEK